MSIFRRLGLAVVAVAALAVWLASGASADSRQIPVAGTGTPQTEAFTPSGSGDATNEEFAGEADGEASPDPYSGNIVDRSLSAGGVSTGVPTTTGKKAKSNPAFVSGFEGLNHYQQRYSRGGNQFSVEPPDQGMCAGNGYVVEA
ncbi:MAG: hypothetical protein E6G22_11990, partial [Actinobacteria bacterium]